VTTTKDLLNHSDDDSENKLASLVGFPSYYSAHSLTALSDDTRKSPPLQYGLRPTSSESLAELPSTKTEVGKIETILKERGWNVQSYVEEEALEENLKESYKPGLLHIATHGFFQPDTTGNLNPLLSSGLFLTGAGNSLKGLNRPSGEDGILTAYEAMNLNLDNTNLVVLSACETGLGEIRNGEGVYGLQRAFKVAGAKSLIMSLWKVDDEATQELMVGFYTHWLSSPAAGRGAHPTAPSEFVPVSHREVGAQLRSAFLAAQKELKARYPSPYYWGAFVMVGE